MLSNLQVPASFLHPLELSTFPHLYQPMIFPLKAQSHTKAYHNLIASINQLKKFNLELI